MLSERPWDPEAVAMFVAKILLSLATGMVLAMALNHYLPEKADADQKFYAFLIGTLTLHGAILVLLPGFLKQHGIDWREFFGLRRPQVKRVIILAMTVGLFVVPMALALNRLSGWIITLFHQKPEEQAIVQVIQQMGGLGRRICSGLATILIAPAAEETLFRGILYPLIKQLGHPVLAVVGTSLLFAAIHLNLMIFLPLAFFAFVLVWLYEKTDSLLAPIVAHAFFNAVNFLLVSFLAN